MKRKIFHQAVLHGSCQLTIVPGPGIIQSGCLDSERRPSSLGIAFNCPAIHIDIDGLPAKQFILSPESGTSILLVELFLQ